MKSGRSLVDLAQELERQLATKKDMVVPSSLMLYRTSEQGVSSVDIDEQTGVQTYGITELARRQLADKLKIPYAYFERMRTEQPMLLDRNVNTWLQEGDADKRLIRTLDGQRACRAVRSLPAARQLRPGRERAADPAAPARGALRVGRADRDAHVPEGRHAQRRATRSLPAMWSRPAW